MNELIKKEFNDDQIQLIKNTFAKGATDDELKMFIHIAQSRGLDPFSRQIYFQKRRMWNSETKNYDEKASIEVSIDGFRSLSAKTGKYAGYKGPLWCGDDGKWVDVWLSSEPPAAAKVGVMRSDFSEPVWAVARFKSYAATKKDGSLTHMWEKMPDLMIAKVAEALARRIAFPDELGGLYTKEEMEQSGNEEKVKIKPARKVVDVAWTQLVPEEQRQTLDEQLGGDDIPDFSNTITFPKYACDFSEKLSILNGLELASLTSTDIAVINEELTRLQDMAKQDKSKAELELIRIKANNWAKTAFKEAA